MRLQFDAGNQTRLLHFKPQAPGERSLQGDSTAKWFRQTQSRGVFAAQTPATGGSLQVHTTNLTAGYLRPNGVPYSEHATVKEFFSTFTLPDGNGTWLVVTTVVNDPEYLTTDLLHEHAVQEGNEPLEVESASRAISRRRIVEAGAPSECAH